MRNAPRPPRFRPVTVAAIAGSLLALAVAGCVTPDEPENPLVGVCPHWTARGGPIDQSVRVEAGTNQSHEWVPRDEGTGEPRPVDGQKRFERILLRVRGVELEAGEAPAVLLSAKGPDGSDLLLYEHGVQERPRSYPVAVLGPRGEEEDPRVFDVYTSSVSQDSTWTPGPVRLQWEARGASADVDFTVTLFDRVCGVP